MIIQDLIKKFRKQVSDVNGPYLWDDDEVLDYVIDAQDMFVRKTGGISDMSTTALTTVAMVASTPFSTLSPYIMRIRSGLLVSTKNKIDFVEEADINLLPTCDYGNIVGGVLDDTDTGEVKCGVLGVEKNKIRWYKVPTANDSVKLHIFRLPYPRITEQEDDLEIDEYHHLHLIEWMKYLAYNKEDAETYDKDLADKNRGLFLTYCEDVKDEEDRKVFKPRTVRYGGI